MTARGLVHESCEIRLGRRLRQALISIPLWGGAVGICRSLFAFGARMQEPEPTSAAAEVDPRATTRWPEGTRKIQSTRYASGFDVGLGPAIHVRIYVWPEADPHRYVRELEHVMHELTHHLMNGHTNGEEEDRRRGDTPARG